MRKKKLTTSLEDFMEAAYELAGSGETRAVDISKKLGISKPSVNAAVKTLADRGLLEHKPYGSIRLSPSGIKAGAEILRRHCLLKDFFTSVLNIPEQQAEQDACRAEHALSRSALDKIGTLTIFLKSEDNRETADEIRRILK